MPRTRNITREQWEAAISPTAYPSTSSIRPLGTTSITQRHHQASPSSLVYADASVDSSSKENRGYDEEYDEENVNNENTPPAVAVDSKGKGKAREEVQKGRKRKPQPLQDITDLVVSHGNRPSDVEETPRGGRRVKRRRHEHPPLASAHPPSTRKHPPNTRKRFPSSLPPSSPPPASFELPASSAYQQNLVWEGIVSEEQEDLPLASDDSEGVRNSDPFGFFAVEKELKAQRDCDNRPPGELREAGGLVLVPASSPPLLHLDITAVLGDEREEVFVSPCATPMTPHKKKRGRRISILSKGKAKEELLYSPHTNSLPSSPSPIKARAPQVNQSAPRDRSDFLRTTVGRSDDVDEDIHNKDEEDAGETIKNTPHHRLLRSRMKVEPEQATSLPPKGTKSKRQRENQSKTPSDPAECAQRLIDRLPKRRQKKAKHGDERKGTKPRQAKRQRKPQVSMKPIKHEKPPKSRPVVDPEREAIRDYFKKLERYSLEEEKVYVI